VHNELTKFAQVGLQLKLAYTTISCYFTSYPPWWWCSLTKPQAESLEACRMVIGNTDTQQRFDERRLPWSQYYSHTIYLVRFSAVSYDTKKLLVEIQSADWNCNILS